MSHHGGDTNAVGFLAATTSEIAVISAGEGNPFGDPHPDVLDDLAGSEVLRTDQDGDVVITLGPTAESGAIEHPLDPRTSEPAYSEPTN